jgi:two-component system, OmpR family, response regulator VicR
MGMGGDPVAAQKTIVCIEDDPQIIDLIRLILQRQNFRLIGVTSSREGLETIRRHRPDLVLLDLMMPEPDGWQILQIMEADHELHTIPVIVVTVRSRRCDLLQGRNTPKVADYVTKPFGIQRLLDSVCGVLGVAA